MKRKYIKPETKKFTVEPLELLTGTNITENGTVDTAAGEGEDDEGEWINLSKKNNLWNDDTDNWDSWK